jgi:hypothetical protein
MFSAYDLRPTGFTVTQAAQAPRRVPRLPALGPLAVPRHTRLAIILDNFSPHLNTKTDTRVRDYGDAHNIELIYGPFNASWLNRIEAPSPACAISPSTAPTTHTQGKGRAIRRYMSWSQPQPSRSPPAQDPRPRTLLDPALAPLAFPHAGLDVDHLKATNPR